MNLLIVEDEQLLARQLINLLESLAPEAKVAGHTTGIEATVKWLETNPTPDLIFMDIELADGQCFEIFTRFPIKAPIIFTTAYDEFALKAFKVNSIDYLLKPIRREDLQSALAKWRELRQQTTPALVNINTLVTDLVKAHTTTPFKDRFLVKQGQKLISVNTSDIAFFLAKNTLNHLVTKSKQKFIIDYTLDELEDLLEPKAFFRANRQFILSHDVIAAVHAWFNGKLKVELNVSAGEEIIISRDRAPHFRNWLGA